jgi:hypothetical protein
MKHVSVWICGFCLSALVGCGGEGGGTVKAGGTVTVNGQPMADLAVMFTPQGAGRPAVGVTDASGHFDLATFAPGDGAAPGTHIVTIVENSTQPPPDHGTPEFEAWSKLPPKVPVKYGDPKQSGLSATVTPGQENSFTFDLKK